MGAVIVAFYPRRESVAELVTRYRKQLDRVVVVDNTPGGADLGLLVRDSGGELLELQENVGIAAALNRGIEYLIRKGCIWFVLSDQDSMPSEDLVHRLMSSFSGLQDKGVRVAAIGASFIDPRTGHVVPFAKPNRCGTGRCLAPDTTGLVPTAYVITSGSLVSLEALEHVGLMAEGLFIDYVDTEWCFRAISKGYRVYGDPAAVMEHTLGDSTVRFWLFGMRQKGLHSPIRVYFQTRNFVLLCRLPHMGICWRVCSLLKRSSAVLLYLLVGRGRRIAYLFSVIQGLQDGLMKREGGSRLRA